MNVLELVLYPLLCASVFSLGYSLSLGGFRYWPFVNAIMAIGVGYIVGIEIVASYVFIGLMVLMAFLAAVGNAALDEVERQKMETSK